MDNLNRSKRLWSEEEVSLQPHFKCIQGYCVIGHRKKYVSLALLRFLDKAVTDDLCAAIVEYGASATTVFQLHQDADGVDVLTAVGLSARGYDRLAPGDKPSSEQFSDGFPGGKFERYDAIIILASKVTLGDAEKKLTDRFKGLASIVWERSKDEERNPLGFEDGISQPVFFEKTWQRTSQQHRDPTTGLGVVLTEHPFGKQEYGSYLAYVKFRLNLGEFQEISRQVANAANTDIETAKSWFLGRKRVDSTPLATLRGSDKNDFTFRDDSEFAVCPAGAHVRSMREQNPETSTHLIYRRGTMYGEPDSEDRGLLFQCFQSSLREGFETLYFEWGKGKGVTRGTGEDALLWPREVAPHPSGTPGKFPSTQPFAKPLDAEYFFFPGIPFFERVLKATP